MAERYFGTLKQRFSNRSNYLQTASGVHTLPFKSIDSQWIIERGRCMYKCEQREEFRNLSHAKREQAIANLVKLWSPFKQPAHHAVWSDNTAMVWFWDAGLVETVQQERAKAGDLGREMLVRPETIYHPRQNTGTYLLRCAEGFELQHWQDSVLRAAASFKAEPTPRELDQFFDLNGLNHTTPEPVGTGELSGEAWASDLSTKDWLLANETRLATAALVLLSTFVVFQEVRFWRISSATDAAAGEFDRLQAEVGPVLQTRNETLRVQDRNLQLVKLVTTPSQALLMSMVDQALPNTSATFQEWHFQQGELRVVVEDPEMSSIDYVRSLEAQALFTNVRAAQARGRNRIELTMTIAAPT